MQYAISYTIKFTRAGTNIREILHNNTTGYSCLDTIQTELLLLGFFTNTLEFIDQTIILSYEYSIIVRRIIKLCISLIYSDIQIGCQLIPRSGSEIENPKIPLINNAYSNITILVWITSYYCVVFVKIFKINSNQFFRIGIIYVSIIFGIGITSLEYKITKIINKKTHKAA